ncbi:MAG: hypothetical protein NC200_02640 [Candidatus Gastranaerophilales bacterium]|nr:hypothetical protein [Candidatus Gastranaerophilales bacterium]
MTVFQSSKILNSVTNQMWGSEAPSVQNTAGLISIGEKILSSDTNKETFLNVLIDRIKRTIIRTLDLSLDFPNLFMSQETFFGILQKINVSPILAQDDNSWNVGNSDFEVTIWNINKPDVTQTFFDNISAFTIPITIPDVKLRSAFFDNEMDTFITAIFSSIESSLLMILNSLSHLAVSNLIAERLKENKEVRLLTMYNTAMGTSLTKTEAETSPDVARYAGMIIRNYMGYMSQASVLFNDGTQVRATQRDNMHVFMLRDFASSYTTYLQSDTFHNELTSLPLYNEVSFWQNQGNTMPNFATNSTINIIPASEEDASEPVAINQDNVICLLADRQALGVSLMDDWTAVDRNNRDRFTNYTFGANRGYFNDLSENAVVFTLT